MTNEEKAELVANGIMIGVQSSFYHTNVYNVNVRCYNHSDLKRAAMEMAKWKDKQFIEALSELQKTVEDLYLKIKIFSKNYEKRGKSK